jgi:hypothetical protein
MPVFKNFLITALPKDPVPPVIKSVLFLNIYPPFFTIIQNSKTSVLQ